MKNSFYIVISLGVLVMAAISYNFFDIAIVSYFYAFKGTDLSHFFSMLTELGKSEYYLIPSLLIYFYFRHKNRVHAMKGAFIFASVALSGIIVLFIKMIGGRFRPEMYFKEEAFGFDFFHITQNMMSFPSGHSATALSMAVALGLLYSRFTALFYFVGISIMISRVVIIRHYPSDILVGGLMGALTSYILYERYFKKEIENAV